MWRHAAFGVDERLDVPFGEFDLAVSILALHAINDLPGALVQIRRALKPDGLFLGALFGGATLFELRDGFAAGEIETLGGITPRVSPFADVRELGSLLQRAGFALPVADVERTTVLYRDFNTLVNDLRLMGETNALVSRSRSLSRATLKAALAHYAAKHAEPDGRVPACDVRDSLSHRLVAARKPANNRLKPGKRKGAARRSLGNGRATGRRQSRTETLSLVPEIPRRRVSLPTSCDLPPSAARVYRARH